MPVPRFRGDFLVWFKARAFYVFLAGLAETVYLRADMLILARFSTLAEVGHYSLAARLCEAVYFVPAILMASFYAKVWDPINPMGITRCRERRMVTVVAALGVLAAVGLSIVAVVIVPSAFGAGYLESIPLMLLYAWSTPFVFIRVFLSRWLIAADILRYSFLATAASAIISIAIYLILIPRYGAVGAAIGTVVAYSVAGVGVFFVFKKTRPIAVTIILELLTVFKITKYRPYYRWMRRRFFLARGA
jgi:O-antigen/teichoic acid export membrane protein